MYTQWFTNRNQECSNTCVLLRKKRENVFGLRSGQGGTWFKKKTRSKKSHATVPSMPNLLFSRSVSLRKNYLYTVIHFARSICVQWITERKWAKKIFVPRSDSPSQNYLRSDSQGENYLRAVIHCANINCTQWLTVQNENHSSLSKNIFMVWIIFVTLLLKNLNSLKPESQPPIMIWLSKKKFQKSHATVTQWCGSGSI